MADAEVATESEPSADAGTEGGEPAEPIEEGAAPAARAPRRTTVRALAVLCVVFLVGAVAMAVVAASLSSKLSDERNGRRDVERVAGRFGEALFTFDYRHLDRFRSGVFALSTGSFQREYDQAFPGLKELITTGQTVSTGTVKDVFVGSIEGHSARAIVVVTAATKGKAGARLGADSYVQLDLVQSGGTWRVDGVTNLNFNAATTPTTSP